MDENSWKNDASAWPQADESGKDCEEVEKFEVQDWLQIISSCLDSLIVIY